MNLSFKQYRAIDLGIMLFILAVSEAVITYAATVWFPDEFYVLSPTIAIVCIVMMRWSGFAAVHAVAGGLALCIASGASASQFAVYCAGNCFALAALILFKIFGKEKIRSKPSLSVLFTVYSRRKDYLRMGRGVFEYVRQAVFWRYIYGRHNDILL